LAGIFYGIGIGPGDPDLITLKAVKILEKIDILAIPESKKEKGSVAYQIAKPFLKKNIETITLVFPMIIDEQKKEIIRKENAEKIKLEIDKGKNVAFLTLGDPMIYSTYIYLLENLKSNNILIQTIPGITTFSAISAKLGIPIVKGDEKFGVISSFDKETEKILELFDCLVFMKISAYKNELIKILKKINRKFYLVSNVGKENEKIISDIGEFENEETTYFSTMILFKGRD
jgi:precorrin-2/cobalt-factor-2 C20-methyltransferase